MKKLNISLSAIEPLIQKISGFSKLQRILIVVGVVGAVIGVFVWFLYVPSINEQTKLKKQISEETEKLKQTKANADEFDKYSKLMAEKKAQFTVVSKQLPQTDEVPALLKTISQAGKDAGLSFLLFQPEAERTKNFYAEIPVKMNLLGSYHDLGDFFDRVAGMSRIVNIRNFEMTSAMQTGKKVPATIIGARSKAAGAAGATKGKGPVTVQTASSELTITCTAETYKFVGTPTQGEAKEAAKPEADKKGKKK